MSLKLSDYIPGLKGANPVLIDTASLSSKVVASQSSGVVADYYTDGTTDATTIQEAIDDLGTNGGEILLKGYTQVSPLRLGTKVKLYSHTVLRGQGIGNTYIKKTDAAMIDMFENYDTTNGNSNIKICDMTIDGNKATVVLPTGAFGRGVKFTKVTRGIIENVQFINCDNRAVDYIQCTDSWIKDCYGIDCGYFQEQTFTIQSSTRCYFVNCIASGGKDRDFIFAYCTDCALYNCISYSPAGASLSLFGSAVGGSNDGIIIDGFISVTPTHEGIYLERTINFKLSNIWIDTPGTEGIRNYGTVSVMADGEFNNIQILNPGANGILSDVDRATYSNIKIENAGNDGMRILGQESIVSNCHVNGAGLNAFRIQGQDTRLANCIGKNAGKTGTANHKNGVRIETTGVGVSGGRYFDDQGSKTQEYGVAEYSPADHSNIQGVDIRGNSNAAGILKAGASSIIRNNNGYITEASGTATINSGLTSVVITHGLSATPTLKDISVTFGENPTSDPGNIWISTITSTQFTINCRNDPGASSLDLAWRAQIF